MKQQIFLHFFHFFASLQSFCKFRKKLSQIVRITIEMFENLHNTIPTNSDK